MSSFAAVLADTPLKVIVWCCTKTRVLRLGAKCVIWIISSVLILVQNSLLSIKTKRHLHTLNKHYTRLSPSRAGHNIGARKPFVQNFGCTLLDSAVETVEHAAA